MAISAKNLTKISTSIKKRYFHQQKKPLNIYAIIEKKQNQNITAQYLLLIYYIFLSTGLAKEKLNIQPL